MGAQAINHLISGGTGGVGGMAIPIAKAKGLKVITNGAGDSAERVLNLEQTALSIIKQRIT